MPTTATAPSPPRARRRTVLPLLGPAFVTAIAYVDPGNFATNITAGSQYGYLLVWVILVSNVIAMLIQYLSAKLGAATGKSLAALCRDHYSRRVSRGLWVQAEAVAIATDLAEIVGGALALKILFGLPLMVGAVITAVVAFVMLGLRRRGHRPFEVVVIGMLAVILVGFVVNATWAGVDAGGLVAGTVPRLDGADSIMLAVGMLGATVMPHAIYLHGGLTSGRVGPDAEPAAVMRAQRIDVVVAMAIAGTMNLLLLLMAAGALSGRGIDTIEGAHAGLGDVLGPVAALLFALSLLASGLAASAVGTLSGQLVMEGFVRRRVPVSVRRLATLLPALAILGLGVDPTRALVMSQVVLSLGIPFALVPLAWITSRRGVMGGFANALPLRIAAVVVTVLVVALNIALLVLTFAP
jgi:manganese transport protein